jgi:hypothetical protein
VPKEQPTPEVVTIEEMLKRAKVNTVDVLPQPQASPPATSQDGAFVAKSGKILYKYEVNGETYILPKAIEDMTEDEFYKSTDVAIFSPSPNKIPHDLYVKFKDPQWAGQWFNHKAGRGQRVGAARSMGFVPAKAEDCEWYAPHLNDKDGALENGDLVLMKIHKAKLYAMFKNSMDDAKKKGGIMRYKEEAQHFGGVSDSSKMDYYHTPQAEREFQGLGPVTNLPTVDTPKSASARS